MFIELMTDAGVRHVRPDKITEIQEPPLQTSSLIVLNTSVPTHVRLKIDGQWTAVNNTMAELRERLGYK